MWQEFVDLQPLNTLRLPAKARYFSIASSDDELITLLKTVPTRKQPLFILGGGSNILLRQDLNQPVIKIETRGKKIVAEDDETVLLEVSAGENWHDLVTFCVEQNWGGIENLAYIPGTVGAAPVQNIAAYGQNFSDIAVGVFYYNIENLEEIELKASDCAFNYRDSIFKHQLKDKAIISKVQLKLYKNPNLETSYYSIGGRNDSLKAELEKLNKPDISIQDIYNIVIAIRKRKLLDWHSVPTVGSFFINPSVSRSELETLQAIIPQLQFYPQENLRYSSNLKTPIHTDQKLKIPAGRLLDFLGWKGKIIGNCFVHSELASIFSHNGRASGQEFFEFTQLIKADVSAKLGIELVSEVTIVKSKE